MDELLIFLACFLIRTSLGIIPSSSVRSSYVQFTQQVDPRQSNYNFDQRNYYRENPPRSYVIYDADVKSAPGGRDRPQSSSTRSWHLEFNEKRRNQPIPPSTPIAHSSVFSNLIQVYDKPQNTYYGDTPNYREPSKDPYYPFSSTPIDVPKYEVIYPYQSEQNNYYVSDKLPDNFPKPFYPNKDFDFKDPTVTSDIRKDYGFYHTQTISYPQDRATRRDNCNYIRLNDKGYPIGNEMCGRSISDLILAPDYPTTGDLVLEHRKRYRGTNQDRSSQLNQLNSFSRRKRNAENIAERFGEFHSYYPSGRCCGEFMATGYGLRPQYRQEFDNRFVSRPYERERDVAYYDYGSQGQNYYNNEDDVGEETSSNQGLTSYLSNRGRGNHGRFNDDNDDDNDSYSDSRDEEQYDRRNSNSSTKDEDSDKRSNGRKAISRSNRKNESSSQSSNNNERSSDSQSQVNNKSVNNRRNLRGDDSEDSFSSSGSSNRGSGGDRGGFGSGGYGSSNGGYNSGGGGYNSDGYNRDNGGRSGGFNSGSGSYNSGSGGFNSGSGSYNSGSRGYNSGSGGYNSRGGGFNTGSGGYNSRRSPNSYGYLNNGGSGRSYGQYDNNMQYGSSVRDSNYRGNENMGMGGQSYWRTSSPYNSNGYSSYGRY